MKSKWKIAFLIVFIAHLFLGTSSIGQVIIETDKYLDSKDVEVYPNPARGKVKIFFRSPLQGLGYITLLDNTGLPVSRKRVEFLKGNNYWDQNLPNQYNSNYWIEIRIDSIIRKVMINNIRSGNHPHH